MAHKNFCDICDIEFEYYDLVHVDRRRGGGGDYCKKCWYDEKNWKEIHMKSASDED